MGPRRWYSAHRILCRPWLVWTWWFQRLPTTPVRIKTPANSCFWTDLAQRGRWQDRKKSIPELNCLGHCRKAFGWGWARCLWDFWLLQCWPPLQLPGTGSLRVFRRLFRNKDNERPRQRIVHLSTHMGLQGAQRRKAWWLSYFRIASEGQGVQVFP